MAAPYAPFVKNEETKFRIFLDDMANPGSFKTNPTIASGDFVVDIDGGGFGNLTTTPSVSPSGGAAVLVSLSADEMNGDVITIKGQDQTSPKEWADWGISICTVAATQDVNVTKWKGAAPSDLVSGRVDVTVGAMQSGTVTAAAIATDAIDADAIADNAINAGAIASGAITSSTFAAGAINAAAIADGAIDAATFAAGAINASAIASGAITSDEAPLLANLDAAVSTLATSSALSAVAADVDAIPAAVAGTGLTTEQATQLEELHTIHGLDSGNPLEVDGAEPGSRTAGAITQTITTSGDVTTVQRT